MGCQTHNQRLQLEAMKLFFKIYPSSWAGDTCFVFGFALSCGKAITVHDGGCPTVSGIRVGIGLVFWQVHFLIGTETKYDWPDIPFGELARLNPRIFK